MTPKVRSILFTVCAAIIATYVVAAMVWVSTQPNGQPCQHVCLQITDSAERQFVSSEELRNYINIAGLNPIGQTMEQISCQNIEQRLITHNMVRTAQCYKSPHNDIYIRITQRVPVLYVASNDGCYYVDSDRKVMPVCSTIRVSVPTFEGAISQRAATHEYYDFAQWLTNNRYWGTRISKVQVKTPKDIVLIQQDPYARILLGTLDRYQEKMNKLRKLYIDGFEQMDEPHRKYTEYDLRYNGQVVARY